MYGTEENLNVLASCEIWLGDGTFQSVLSLFTQLYTLHGLVEGKVLPLTYVLTSNKCKKTYVQILRKLKELNPGLEPRLMLVDFEVDMITAFEAEFPSASQKYNNDGDFALHTRMLAALAFVDSAEVVEAYEFLLETPYYQANMNVYEPLLDYMEDNWIGVKTRRQERRAPSYCIEMWNQFENVVNDQPRTTNAVEGWHHGFNESAQTAHLCLWKFIDLIKTEQALTEAWMEQLNAAN
ncbi:uncharacterized protein LOC107039903 [Diachasma alloeum]|uniref:uncharacterized protein LOC107039903 n=1 Tax=Diachasma alloeum TaxID=454923 RepID=UPI0007384C69|nr:uncharacterized protein LOC107039903 [Diachasma alloeum]